MNFSDLPNQGHNLRLYTYDPLGSQFNPGTSGPCIPGSNGIAIGGGNIYNTGHYDIALGDPCSQPDPKAFCDWQSLSAYAGARGEFLVLVSRSDLATVCAFRSSNITPTGPIQTQVSAAGGGVVIQGGSAGATIISGGGGTGSGTGYVPGSIPPPGTPISQGGIPSGGTVGQTAPRGLGSLYRFILYNSSQNIYQTGANYPGCSAANIGPCRAKNFLSLQDAIDFSEANGEIPYQILSIDEAWQLVNGNADIDPKRLLGSHTISHLNVGMIGIIALGLWFLSGR